MNALLGGSAGAAPAGGRALPDSAPLPPTSTSPPGPPSTPSPPSKPSDPSLFSTLFSDNPLFNAGFGLMLLGSGLAIARRGVTAAAGLAQRRLLVSLEIPSKDRAHPWFLHWMGAQAQAQSRLGNSGAKESLRELIGFGSAASSSRGPAAHTQAEEDLSDPLLIRSSDNNKSEAGGGSSGGSPPSASRRVSPIRIFSHDLSVETAYDSHPSAKEVGASAEQRGRAKFNIVPGPGTHWFRYRGHWMRLQRERNGKLVDLNTGAPWETITLTTLYSSRHLFPVLLAEARQLALASTEGKTVIYTAWGAEWRPFGKPRRTRELGSVILGKGKREAVQGDLQRFLNRGKWYAERGIPYRRGYLLHGSPGSGKTSFITALAGALDFNICLLNLSERGLTDDKLNHLLSNAPERSLLLLEDVDAAFLGRNKPAEADGYQANVTFSGLLNALDGVASGESRIVFMTTNHIERLDPALIRPGRVDVIQELGDAEEEQVVELVLRFYGREGMGAGSVAEAQLAARANEGGVEGSTTSPNPGSAGFDKSTLLPYAKELANLVREETLKRRQAMGLSPTGHPRLVTPGKQVPAARGGVSMAELQNLMIAHPEDVEGAIRSFREDVMTASTRYFEAVRRQQEEEEEAKAQAKAGRGGTKEDEA